MIQLTSGGVRPRLTRPAAESGLLLDADGRDECFLLFRSRCTAAGHQVIWFDILPKPAQKLIVACVLARLLCVLVSMMDELLPGSISLMAE